MTAVDRDLATRRYASEQGIIHIKLLPKEYYVTDQPFVLTTVLGSCVAVCLWDAAANVAGMNHFMLPDVGRAGDERGDSMVYGRHATQRLVDALMALGARRDRLEAKLFGGASVLTDMRHARIGELNAAFARDYLARSDIPVRAADLGGSWPRQLQFDAATRMARVRRLQSVDSALAARERGLMAAAANVVRGAHV